METFIDNLKINYIKKGKGRSVLIIPGWGTVINTYTVLINSISEYANVLCLDMPGFGESDEPLNSWNLDNYIEFIIKFIKSQKIKELDVIGHSNGGRIIIKLMSRSDLEFKINKIILIGSEGIVHKKTILELTKIYTFKVCRGFAQMKIVKLIFPNLLDKVKSSFGSADYKNASSIMRETMVKLINEDVREFLPNIKVPTLLIWGENDDATPIKDAEIMEKLIPDAGLIRLKGCGHYVFLENPSYVNIIINNFLNGGRNENDN